MAIMSTSGFVVGPALTQSQWAAKMGVKVPTPTTTTKPTVQTTTARPASVKTTSSAGLKMASMPSSGQPSFPGFQLPFFPAQPKTPEPKQEETSPTDVAMLPEPSLFDLGPPAKANKALGVRTPAMENLIKQFQQRIY